MREVELLRRVLLLPRRLDDLPERGERSPVQSLDVGRRDAGRRGDLEDQSGDTPDRVGSGSGTSSSLPKSRSEITSMNESKSRISWSVRESADHAR